MEQILLYGVENTRIADISRMLMQEGYRVIRQEGGKQDIVKTIGEQEIYLLLFHTETGGEEDLALIEQIRKQSSIPIVVLSEEEREEVKIAAFDAGADDYVTAGCNPLEVLARVKSQLRRYTQLANMCENINRIYRVDDLEIDDIQRKVMVSGREVKLTPLEYKILKLLVQERGRVLSIEQIYETIWNMKAIGADNIIAVHIRHIREKIEKNPKEPKYLKAVWGTGYKVG